MTTSSTETQQQPKSVVDAPENQPAIPLQGGSVVDEIRGYLMDEIRKLRDGTTTAANSNAVTNAAGKYFNSIKLELEVCHITGRTPRMDILGISTATMKEKNNGKGS